MNIFYRQPYEGPVLRRVVKLCLAAALTMPAGASAQEGLEEIVVTAQRRAQSLQDVPIAVSAFSAEDLQSRGVGDVAGVGDFTPNVTIHDQAFASGSTSVLTAFVRGIGQSEFAINFDPGVGIYLDGVYLARSIGANFDLLDVERIEVLKGPQGTLFGRNTLGGAVNIVTRQPAKEFKAVTEFSAGSFNRRDVRGAVDIPLVEGKLYSTIAFTIKTADGYLQRVPFPSSTPFVDEHGAWARTLYGINRTSDTEGGRNEQNIRGKLLWEASDDVSVTFQADHGHVNQESTANKLLAVNTTADPTRQDFVAIYNLCINTPAAVLDNVILVGGQPVFNTTNGVCSPRASIGTPLGGVNADANPYNDMITFDERFLNPNIDQSYATGSSISRTKSWGGSALVDWRLSDSLNFKSITSYRELDWLAGLDGDGSPMPALEFINTAKQEQLSQEFQLNGKSFNDRLDWLVGAYYFDENAKTHDFVNIGFGLLQIFGPIDLSTKAYALFTHNTFKITDKLSVTVGARWTKEDKEMEAGQADLNLLAPKLGVPAFLFPDQNDLTRYFPLNVDKRSFSKVTARAGFEYAFTPDLMTYFSFSQGFKSGGWTTRLSAPELTFDNLRFKPETANTYELGLKSEWLDRRLTTNVALFHTDYKDIQVTELVGVSPFIKNAGTGKIDGAELEFQAMLARGFVVRGGIGYIDARYTELSSNVAYPKDNKFAKTPSTTASLSPEYSFNVASGAEFKLRADYVYTGKIQNDSENSPVLEREAASRINASVQYVGANENWSLTAGGTNLTDKRYIVTGQNSLNGIGIAYGGYNRPREWYMSLRYDY